MSQADIEAQRKALLELVDAEEKNLLAEYYSGRLNGDQRIKSAFARLRAALRQAAKEPEQSGYTQFTGFRP